MKAESTSHGKWCAARPHQRFKRLQMGLALVCAALLSMCAEAVTELEYSGEVYYYEIESVGAHKWYWLNDSSLKELGVRSNISKFSDLDETCHVAVVLKSGSLLTKNC